MAYVTGNRGVAQQAIDHFKQKDIERQQRAEKRNKKKQKGLGKIPNQNNPVEWYNSKDAKGNVQNAALKTGIDVLTSAVGGSYLGAIAGKYAPLLGAILVFSGHYSGDQTGLLRNLGNSVIANGVAKVKEYHKPDSNLKERLTGVKDDLLYAFFLKRLNAQSEQQKTIQTTKHDPSEDPLKA